MRKTFTLLSLLCFVFALSAQNYEQLIAHAGDTKTFPKSDVVVIFDSTSVEMQATGLSYYQMHTLTKILTTEGAKHHNIVKVGYDPLSAYVEIQKVVIHKSDGEDIVLKNPVLDYAAPARAIYWGAREKMMEVGRLEPGDAVEVISFKKDILMPYCREAPMMKKNIFLLCVVISTI